MSTSMAGPAADRAAWQARTAFVLAGGAALAAMQAGMIHALYERGIAPDLLIGTSAGALNAAFLASRPATVATARYAQSAELIVLPAVNPGHIPPTDFGHAGQLITWALTATRTALTSGTPNPLAAGMTPAGPARSAPPPGGVR